MKSFKIYTPITKEKQMKLMNHKYLSDKKYIGEQFSYNDVIQSCTGTGKTTAIAEHISKYIKNKPYKILSIINRITLGDQYVKSFSWQRYTSFHI
jgi:superfamily II DNA or RNA helicase